MEFDDMDAARGWYESAAYREAMPLRQGASRTDILLVDGV
jgi:uncharacterized protein (DUF1330 family)